MSNKCEDIIDLHAPLIHKARDIQFQITYDNNGNPASIICIDEKNVQFALESYFSQVGIPVKGEQPTGLQNNVNLTYTVADEFVEGTLEVFLSGYLMNGNQTDPDRDYDIITTGPNTNKGFVIRLDAGNQHRLNAPPQQNESLLVNYAKRITFDTKGGT